MHRLKNKTFIKSWIIPLIMAAGIFVLTRPVAAQILVEQTLADYIEENTLEVGTEVYNGYERAYYVFNDQKSFISPEGQNSRHAFSEGRYVVFATEINGAGQVSVYDVIGQSLVNLTSGGTNLEPRVSKEGKVVWEGWVPEEDGWQVFLFDGLKISQLTQGELSLNPDIEGDFVVYARKSSADEWRAVSQYLGDGKTTDISVGNKYQNPRLENEKIYFEVGSRTEDFSLTAADLSALDLNVLSAEDPEQVTQEEIKEELEASQ